MFSLYPITPYISPRPKAHILDDGPGWELIPDIGPWAYMSWLIRGHRPMRMDAFFISRWAYTAVVVGMKFKQKCGYNSYKPMGAYIWGNRVKAMYTMQKLWTSEQTIHKLSPFYLFIFYFGGFMPNYLSLKHLKMNINFANLLMLRIYSKFKVQNSNFVSITSWNFDPDVLDMQAWVRVIA